MHSKHDTDRHETPESDTRLASLLRTDAPPDQDPFFRMAILERRERLRYRRRMHALAFTAVTAPVLLALLSRLQAGPLEALLTLLIFGVLAGTCFRFIPALARILHGIGRMAASAKE